MIITTAAKNEVISNGRLLSRKKNSDDTVTFHWLQDKPHVAYLISLIVGDFHVERETWRDKPVGLWLENYLVGVGTSPNFMGISPSNG